MAETISINLNIRQREESGNVKQVANDNVNISKNSIGYHGTVVKVGTSEEVLATGDVDTEGVLYMRNLDADNFVTWGPESGGSMVAIGQLDPGEIAYFRMKPSVTMRWQANTAEVQVEMWLAED